MQEKIREQRFEGSALDKSLYRVLEAIQIEAGLAEAIPLYEFPLYRDDDGNIVSSRFTVLSPNHGVIILASHGIRAEADSGDLAKLDADLEHLASLVYSRLIKNKALRKTATTLKVGVSRLIFAPHCPEHLGESTQAIIVRSKEDLLRQLAQAAETPIDANIFLEMRSSVEGAKGILRPSQRDKKDKEKYPFGYIVASLEDQIAAFDKDQKEGYVEVLSGPQRIRGLAGSGKTVVLCMKAAITHVRNPDATILYTFYTKSLYQQIKRLITRFYRQFDDRDPDWEKIHVLHAWGGSSVPGVYSTVCELTGVDAISFAGASALRQTGEDQFDFVCKSLLKATKIPPVYDNVIVDEGQDFPPSFLKLAFLLARNQHFVYAYDELQTIFRPTAVTPEEFLGKNGNAIEHKEFQDIVLHKCYRNPRELIVVAHAVGFGIYGNRIIQMLENNNHWKDLGYDVLEGEPKVGSQYKIERPTNTSLELMSKFEDIDSIVDAKAFPDYSSEVKYVVQSIQRDIQKGLKPDDILVEVVDDQNAKKYLRDIERGLNQAEIRTNNIHASGYGLQDFFEPNSVTLSTVHKAKGNESYMVYVVGVDALFAPTSVRNRNMLFTSMTRAKGWLRISGYGRFAEKCVEEVAVAKRNFPFLIFNFPSEQDLKVMRRDLRESEEERIKIDRIREELRRTGLSEEQLQAIVASMNVEKRLSAKPSKLRKEKA